MGDDDAARREADRLREKRRRDRHKAKRDTIAAARRVQRGMAPQKEAAE